MLLTSVVRINTAPMLGTLMGFTNGMMWLQSNRQGNGNSVNSKANACTDPTSITITIPHDHLRMISPERLFTIAPSTNTFPSNKTGTNTPGKNALARTAFHNGPRSNTVISLLVRLQETQKKLTHRSSMSVVPYISFAQRSSTLLRTMEMNG